MDGQLDPQFGHFALVAAFLLSVYGLIVGLVGIYRRDLRISRSAGNATHFATLLGVLSLVALAVLFLRHDYRVAYVWRTSNNDMPPWYLVSAIWGGMDGSMLLWAVFASAYASLALRGARASANHGSSTVPWVVPIVCLNNVFFYGIVTFFTNPFRFIPTDVVPANGSGLNPLLQNPSMLIHPITLYLGFTGFLVPFAFCMGALLSGNLSADWVRETRRWTLLAWSFLTVGIMLGGHWAYVELGWGGFWAWDPVENASFFPWLTGTAFLHSVIVQERRQMLKMWNVSLCLLTYLLTVFGTFLTRSGVVQSVHAFAEGNIGPLFLGYLILLIVLGFGLVFYRRRELRSENYIQSYFSREAAFLFNNLVLLAILFATLWGVMFPVISEAFGYQKSVVGPPFFNRVNGPLFLFLLLLMACGPLIAWRRSSWASFFRLARATFFIASLVLLGFFVFDPSRPGAALGFGLGVLVIGVVGAEFHRAARVRRGLVDQSYAGALVQVIKTKPARYGGYLVHLGVGVMAIAITGATVYKIERDFVLAPGERLEVGRYALELTDITQSDKGNYSALHAQVKVSNRQTGAVLGMLEPEQRFYPASQQTTTEVDIRSTLGEDLYLALAGIEDGDTQKGETQTAVDAEATKVKAAFKVFVNPLQVWVWCGGVVIFLGAAVLVISSFAEARERQPVTTAVPGSADREVTA